MCVKGSEGGAAVPTVSITVNEQCHYCGQRHRCGHCKKLVPVYEKVGKAFADNDSVVITKFDATANDIPDTKKFQVHMAELLHGIGHARKCIACMASAAPYFGHDQYLLAVQ